MFWLFVFWIIIYWWFKSSWNCCLYQEAINSISKETYGKVSKELISMLHQIENNVEYHHSFMFDATVYKIDDVRKREENERSK